MEEIEFQKMREAFQATQTKQVDQMHRLLASHVQDLEGGLNVLGELRTGIDQVATQDSHISDAENQRWPDRVQKQLIVPRQQEEQRFEECSI